MENGDNSTNSESSKILTGLNVLARRYSDNFYYSGTVKKKINDVDEKFLIEFGECKDSQETNLVDIIALEDAKRIEIQISDKVLAERKTPGDRIKYEPAIVTERNDEQIKVVFVDGRCESVGFDKAIWITKSLYGRLISVCCNDNELVSYQSKNFDNMSGRIFEDISERNVIFCIDSSGSMYECLEGVKDELINTLKYRARNYHNTLFNLIEFSSNVISWSDKCIDCNIETVNLASEWIRNIQPKTTSNLLEALLTALDDEQCDAVCLITDSVLNADAEEILDYVISAAKGRPIHCYFLQRQTNVNETADACADSISMQTTRNFLGQLATETYGRFHIINFGQNGHFSRMTPLLNDTRNYDRKYCSVNTSLDRYPNEIIIQPPFIDSYQYYNQHYYHHPPLQYYYYCYPYYGWSKYTPTRGWLQSAERLIDVIGTTRSGYSDDAGRLLIGKDVLARNHVDGYFYKAKVKSQLLDDKFLIEFGPRKAGQFNSLTYQETYVFDILACDDAVRYSINTNDYVLAPVDRKSFKYAPGIVLSGRECREDRINGQHDIPLVVKLSHGSTVEPTNGSTIWIPATFYDRISFELNLPRNVRNSLPDQFKNYPRESRDGYPNEYDRFVSVDYRKQNGTNEKRLFYKNGETDLYRNCVIPGTNITSSQLNSIVSSQIDHHRNWLDGGKLLDRRRHSNTTQKSVKFDDEKSEKQTDSGIGSTSDLRSDLTSATTTTTTSIDQESKTKKTVVGSDNIDELDLLDLDIEIKAEERKRLENETNFKCDCSCRSAICCQTRRNKERKAQNQKGPRPRWKYWKGLQPPKHQHRRFPGYEPFRETLLAAPLEVRIPGNNAPTCQNSYNHNETICDYNRPVTVKDSMGYYTKNKYCKQHKPHPPVQTRFVRSVVPPDHHESSQEELKMQRREEFKRNQHARRLEAENETQLEFAMRQAANNQKQREIYAQRLEKQREKRMDEEIKLEQQAQAKRLVGEEIRGRLGDQLYQEKERRAKRLMAASYRREIRETESINNVIARENLQEKRQLNRQERVRERNEVVTMNMVMDEQKRAIVESGKRKAKVDRIQHYRDLENRGQDLQNRRFQIAQEKMAIEKSRIFP